MELSVQLFIES